MFIDGVDVSKCEFAEPSATTPKCRAKDWEHCDGINCDFKKLALYKEQVELKMIQIKDHVDSIQKYALRLDEDTWGTLDWKIMDETKEILAVIEEPKLASRSLDVSKKYVLEPHHSKINGTFHYHLVISPEQKEDLKGHDRFDTAVSVVDAGLNEGLTHVLLTGLNRGAAYIKVEVK